MSDKTEASNTDSLINLGRNLAIIYDNVDNTSTSLVKYTKPTRVNPPLTATRGFTQLDPVVQSDCAQTAVSMYAGSYRQAFELMNLKVGNVSAVSFLDALSTERSFRTAFGNESISTTTLSNYQYQKDIELMDKISNSTALRIDTNDLVRNESIALESMNKDDLSTWSNLAVGKTLVFKIMDQNAKRPVDLTVSIRALPQVIDASVLFTAMENTAKDNSFMGRFHRTRAGELSVLEFLTLSDLIKLDRKAKIKDVNSIISDARIRQRNGAVAALISKRKSVNTVSGIMMMTKEEAFKLEKSSRGKMHNFKDRQAIMGAFGCMILMVADPSHQTCTIYLDGIKDEGIFLFDDLRDKNSSASGMDMKEMIKAYNMGSVGL